MAKFHVTAEALNLRKGPSTDFDIIAELPKNFVVEKLGESTNGKWFEVEVNIHNDKLSGFASAHFLALHQEPEKREFLSNARFNRERRTEYIDSILKENGSNTGDKFNFLRPARQAFSGGRWLHGYTNESGEHFEVGVSWRISQEDGKLEVVQPTKPLTSNEFELLFPNHNLSTFCNFNVSYCYQQAYFGQNLQDSNGTASGGERSANAMVSFFESQWRQVDGLTAAKIANAGGFVVAAWRNPNGSGHVVFLVEGSPETGVLSDLKCFHVGGGLPRLTTIKGAFGDRQGIKLFVDPETQDEWLSDSHTISSIPLISSPITPSSTESTAIDSFDFSVLPPFSIDSDLKERLSPLTAESIDNYFTNKKPSALAGIGNAVMEASQKYKINATYIVAHAILETGWGKSRIYREKNNLFGWGAIDDSPFAGAGRFPSREACIDFVMGRVNELYLKPTGRFFTLKACVGNKQFGMNAKYASDPRWGESIASIARRLERDAI